MYEVSDRRNMAEKPVRGIAPVERLLERLLGECKPDAVVCTYMVYPYMLDSLASRTGRAVPYLTVVTDSFVRRSVKTPGGIGCREFFHYQVSLNQE